MTRATGFYEKTSYMGREAYCIAIGIEDPRIYRGALPEAKRAACEEHHLKTTEVKWLKWN